MLHLIGNGKICAELQQRSNGSVCWHGWQSEAVIQHEIEMCEVGIIPHVKCEHTDNTIPHKLFQFWAHSKPVIVSNCNPLKRIVESVGGGLVFESGNVEDLKAKILMLSDPRFRKLLGENGYYAVQKYYNWQTSEAELLNCYK